MWSKKFFCAFTMAMLALAPAPSLRADDGWDRASLTLVEENDSSFSDRHYTQGALIFFLSADHTNRGCITSHIPSFGYDAPRWKWGLEAGHQIFTPEDLSATKPIYDDRPYAGWLYGGLDFQQRGTNAHGVGVMETFRLLLGVVGPPSQADEWQTWWHRTFGFQQPNGWGNQIHTEIGGQFNYDRRYRYAVGDVWSVQFLPFGGVDLGNVRIDAHLGSMVRAGYNIPNEFGVGESKPGTDFGCYVFTGAFGSAVALDIFLDGNNFQASQSVDKKELTAELRFGVAFTTRHVELSLTHVRRTHEFDGERESSGFTSVALVAKF